MIPEAASMLDNRGRFVGDNTGNSTAQNSNKMLNQQDASQQLYDDLS